jgi:threonine/homoserine/homoserine lactone efflux protein
LDLLTLLAFTIAYIVAVLVPGPGVAAIVGRALGGGFWSAVPMILGILVGDLLYLVFAIFGLAAIAALFGPLFIIIRFASAAYLLYIAWKFWSAKPGKEQLGPRAKEPWLRTFVSGFALTLSNPKTIAFYLALLPTVVPLNRPITALGFAELVVIVSVILIASGCGYAWLAAWAREVFVSPRAVRNLNRTAGVIMASAAAFVAARG